MAAYVAGCGCPFLRRSCVLAFARARFYSDKVKAPITLDISDTGNRTDMSTVENEAKKSTFTGSFVSAGESALSEFAKALEKNAEEKPTEQNEEDNVAFVQSFASMLRNSKLMQIGEMSNRIVLGTMMESIADDLYIDFGGKFHCVCPKPTFKPEKCHYQGVRVKINLYDLEMTSAFLGSKKHLTLQEADGTLIGLHHSSK